MKPIIQWFNKKKGKKTHLILVVHNPVTTDSKVETYRVTGVEELRNKIAALKKLYGIEASTAK